ncbi:CBBY-like protein isoform X2 [Manihot esculenta]|uniref:CBBY-like protein isoform X2 n=1 Tax=Manihot esculenta TaxID=3983 RepID=UPI000B5D93E7|nr:CBBY-like protein isoform X2 [Manihot esculenta]
MASMTISLSFSAVSSSISSASFSSQTKTPIKSHQTNLSSTLFGAKVCAHRTLRSKSSTQISTSIGVTCLAPASSVLPSALLFDCDGVLVDTEKDGHRVSFNDTFNEKELGVTWDVELYGVLLKIGGGKERLIDQALGKGVKVAVCSTSVEKAVSTIVSCLLGPERAEKIKVFAGDVVARKKPDPAIYTLAANTLGVDPSSCVVVEDSAIGLAAAKAAGMKCIVTRSGYTADEDFLNADAVFDCIGDPPEERFDLAFCGSLLEKKYVS